MSRSRFKRTAFHWTFREVQGVLRETGGADAESLGALLWPDIRGGSSKGGPSNAAVAASFLLGRMARQGLVKSSPPLTRGNPWIWRSTEKDA